MPITQEPHYGLYTGMVGGFTDRVNAEHVQQLSTMLAMIGNRIAQIFGQGALLASDFNGTAGVLPNYTINTGVGLVGDVGNEVVRALTVATNVVLVNNTTNYVYMTKLFSANGQPALVVRDLISDALAATPNPNTLQLARIVVNGVPAITTEDFFPVSRVNHLSAHGVRVTAADRQGKNLQDALALVGATMAVLNAGGNEQLQLTVPNAGAATRGLVLKAAASANSAPAQTGAYVQADVQAILTELRDLKTKLQTGGTLT